MHKANPFWVDWSHFMAGINELQEIFKNVRNFKNINL